MNHEEAWAICQRNLMKVSDEELAQLRTLSDNDLTRIAQTADWFALLESNRRLSVALPGSGAHDVAHCGGIRPNGGARGADCPPRVD